MLKILFGFIILPVLPMVILIGYYLYVSDIHQTFYSNHYTYKITPAKGAYMITPAHYTHWFQYRDNVTGNYGEVLYAFNDTLVVHAIAHDDVLVKDEWGQYYKPKRIETCLYGLTKENYPVHTSLYLLFHLLIYMLLVAVSMLAVYLISKRIFNDDYYRTEIVATLLAFVYAVGFLGGRFFLYDWFHLFWCWIRF